MMLYSMYGIPQAKSQIDIIIIIRLTTCSAKESGTEPVQPYRTTPDTNVIVPAMYFTSLCYTLQCA